MKKNLQKLPLAGICICFCALIGCRAHDGNAAWKTVEFVSEPDRATLFINGRNCGLTPRAERLDRSASCEVRFSKPGYFDEDRELVPVVPRAGAPADIPDRLEVTLVKITPESAAARASAGTPAGDDSRGNSMSPAAAEFSAQGAPANFTELRLREEALDRLFRRGEITEDERRSLLEALHDAYGKKRSSGESSSSSGEKMPRNEI